MALLQYLHRQEYQQRQLGGLTLVPEGSGGGQHNLSPSQVAPNQQVCPYHMLSLLWMQQQLQRPNAS
jgi:hypothetical protein